jgi:hypothetical protein
MSIKTTRKTKPKGSDVGSNVLEEAQGLLKQVTAIVGTAPALTAKDRQRSAKLRKGGETVIPTVATLSEQFGLTVSSHPTKTMVAKAKQAQSLIPLHKQLVTATKNVADQMFSANSESWAAAQVHYSMLRRLAKTDGDLATALAPIEEFFARRSTSVRAERSAKKAALKAAKAPKAPAAAEAGEASSAIAPAVAQAPALAAEVTPVSATPAVPAPINPPTHP